MSEKANFAFSRNDTPRIGRNEANRNERTLSTISAGREKREPATACVASFCERGRTEAGGANRGVKSKRKRAHLVDAPLLCS